MQMNQAVHTGSWACSKKTTQPLDCEWWHVEGACKVRRASCFVFVIAICIFACMGGKSQTRHTETGLEAAHLRARQKPLEEAAGPLRMRAPSQPCQAGLDRDDAASKAWGARGGA